MEQSIAQDERQARAANAADLWDGIWADKGEAEWREHALARVYDRIIDLFPTSYANFIDVGGGVGTLAKRLVEIRGVTGVVADHSTQALDQAAGKDIGVWALDLENRTQVNELPPVDVFISTETFEHLSADARRQLMEHACSYKSAFISVPNNCLGPDVEPQHTVQFTAMGLKRELQEHWAHVRIEVFGRYLLAVCGEIAIKQYTLSATLPVRDEGRDLEPTLASLRAIADELIVGIDPRTKDDTWEVAERYADKVFFLKDPMGPPDGHSRYQCEVCHPDGVVPGRKSSPCKEYMGEDGINFSWARNQCIEQCSGDWIFMTEGHERLAEGVDQLLRIQEFVPEQARVGFVYREGNGQRWAFPWLFKNSPDIRFKRPVHNVLDFPEGTYAVHLPQIRTVHERHDERGKERATQRRGQNRRQLMDDWQTNKNVNSLFYLGQEWREMDPQRAVERLDQFIHVTNNGVQSYQARLILAKESMRAGDNAKAREYLMGCTEDDWSRTEHWVWLGDLATMEEEYEKAYRFYMYAATSIGDSPFTVWWIDLCYYSYLPAQRLAATCGELGRAHESLAWARKVEELLPADSPPEAFEEAQANITLLEEAIDGTH